MISATVFRKHVYFERNFSYFVIFQQDSGCFVHSLITVSQYLILFFKGLMFKGYDVDVVSFKLPKNFHMQYIS